MLWSELSQRRGERRCVTTLKRNLQPLLSFSLRFTPIRYREKIPLAMFTLQGSLGAMPGYKTHPFVKCTPQKLGTKPVFEDKIGTIGVFFAAARAGVTQCSPLHAAASIRRSFLSHCFAALFTRTNEQLV